MSNAFTQYETGLTQLLKRLGSDHPRYAEALTLKSRLLENIAQAQRYGDTEIRRAERAQIVEQLNQLAVETAGVSFDKLCRLPEDRISKSFVPGVAYLVLGLLLLDATLALILGLRFFTREPATFRHLGVVVAFLAVGLEILLAIIIIWHRMSAVDALRWLGRSRLWQVTIGIVTLALILALAWPTKLPQAAQSGEILVLIVPADENHDSLYDLKDQLQRQAGESFRIEVYPQVIPHRESAVALATRHNASFLVWGTTRDATRLDFIVLSKQIPRSERVVKLKPVSPDPSARVERLEGLQGYNIVHVANLALGLFYFHSDDCERAISFLESLPLQEEDTPVFDDNEATLALLRLGTSYASIGDFDQAFEKLNSALDPALNPNPLVRASVLNNKAWALGQMGKHEDALKALAEAREEAEHILGGEGLVSLVEFNYCCLFINQDRRNEATVHCEYAVQWCEDAASQDSCHTKLMSQAKAILTILAEVRSPSPDLRNHLRPIAVPLNY